MAGRARYLSVLTELSSVETESCKDNEYRIKKFKTMTYLKQFIENLFDMIPETSDGNISLNELAKGISGFLGMFVKVKSELDAEAKAAVTESLNQIASGAELFKDFDYALRIFKRII